MGGGAARRGPRVGQRADPLNEGEGAAWEAGKGTLAGGPGQGGMEHIASQAASSVGGGAGGGYPGASPGEGAPAGTLFPAPGAEARLVASAQKATKPPAFSFSRSASLSLKGNSAK